MGEDARDPEAAVARGEAAAAAGGDAGAGPSQQQAAGDDAAEAMQEDQPDAAAAAAQAAQGVEAAGVPAQEEAAPEGGRRRRRRSDRRDSSSSSSGEEGVDREMEGELVNAVRGKQGKGEDPLSAYDMDVSEDGKAIQLYLSLLASANGSSRASGSSAPAASAGGS